MWVRVEDTAPDHPKFGAAGKQLGAGGVGQALALFLVGLCYANRNLTDGAIPRHVVVGMYHVPRPLRVADALVSAGLWRTAEDGYQIHDYEHYQPTAAKVKEKRESDRKRKGFRTESKRNPNGIETESAVPGGARGTGSLSSVTSITSLPRVLVNSEASVVWFDRVYAAYPNKDRKLAANEAWVQLGPNETTSAAILANIQGRIRAGWVRLERRFIPLLKTYLVERQWEDQPSDAPAGAFDDPHAGLPHAWQCARCGDVHEGTREQASQKQCPAVLAARDERDRMRGQE